MPGGGWKRHMADVITVLGSTGSIGTQALEIARHLGIKVKGLSAGRNTVLLLKQIIEFKPAAVSVEKEEDAAILRRNLPCDCRGTEVLSGSEGLSAIAAIDGADMVLGAAAGIASLQPVLDAIGRGRKIALANKEILVAAGRIVMEKARDMNVQIIPVDSEHSAIFQCLAASSDREALKGIMLTASGGPFRGLKDCDLEKISVEDALKHPNWKMGRKVTIDSATLMNKGFEVIEARWLFGLDKQQIKVLIHPQSIIHSMVEFTDGSVMAQMGVPDMRVPIQYAFTYPYRKPGLVPAPDFIKISSLTFEEPDMRSFPCLRLAFEALDEGGTMTAVLNAADDSAVSYFLSGKTGFGDIPEIIEKVLDLHINYKTANPCLEEIIEADKWAHLAAESIIEGRQPPQYRCI